MDGTPTAYPIRTERLVLRIMGPADVAAFVAYRNDPEVARHQLWDLPYTEADAHGDLDDQEGREDVLPGRWTQIAVEKDGVVIGDVCCHLHETGAVAEVGYTLAREHWGHGYATEAALALVADLVERVGVGRVVGELDPPNGASARVLERIGLVHEADSERSFLWRGAWTDNRTYAVTAEGWRAWRDRPAGPPSQVRLVDLDRASFAPYAGLEPHHSQRGTVPTPAELLALALLPEDGGARGGARLRGVEADGVPTGLVVTDDMGLVALLVDRRHQGRGIEERVRDLVEAS